VAAAITIVQGRLCANARCEDGQDLDQGGDCPACEGGKRRTDRPAQQPTPAPVAPAPAPAAVAPAAKPTPASASVEEKFAELAALTAVPPVEEEPRSRSQKAPSARGEIAKAAIEATRASLRPRKLSDREKELQAAKDRVYCEKCGAEAQHGETPGSWCINGDGVETIGFIHPARILALRAAQQADQPADQEGQVA
jgi:hypothetical protein